MVSGGQQIDLSEWFPVVIRGSNGAFEKREKSIGYWHFH